MAGIAGTPDMTVTGKPLVGLRPGTIPRAVDLQVDVLVVGLGPGGLIACRDFARQGFTVLGIDRKQELGWPKRCAEGVSDEGLAHCGVKADPAWAYGRIEGAALYAPSGKRVILEGSDTYGWVVERKIFEKHLARDAIQAGAKLMVKTQATALLKDAAGAVVGVEAEFMGKRFQVRARLTIGADGIDSFIGKWAGLRTLNRVRDYHAGFQYEMVGVQGYEQNWLHLYFGEDVAPKGYVWIFPKGDGVSNVGIGILAKESEWGNRAQDYLDRWIERNPQMFAHASVTEINGSGIPVSSRVPEPVADGVMLVGDAAQLVNPIHGGGIIIAMRAAMIAARVGGEAIRKGDVSKAALQPYVVEYQTKDEGAVTEKLLKMRYFMENLTDKDFERLAGILDGKVIMEVANAQFPTFVKLLLKHFPKMAPLVRKYILAVKQMEQEKAKRDWDEVDELLAEAEAKVAA
ncbi:MAG: digeranylgeranylglycerophospholipid reductase [Thermoplasmata archaeon]|jgi:digeranylgeranylglycerophospholipid reductase|nr:digeranylgeranylglycerophospholipid reductase [Thermoplasmata archaeon]